MKKTILLCGTLYLVSFSTLVITMFMFSDIKLDMAQKSFIGFIAVIGYMAAALYYSEYRNCRTSK